MTEQEKVVQVVVDAYVEGVHRQSDLAVAAAGFAEEFRMLSCEGERIVPVTLEELIGRVQRAKAEKPDLVTTYQVDQVDVAGTAAWVKLQLFRNGEYFFTDYLSLYRFPGGWRIVAKTYAKDPEMMKAGNGQ